VVIKFFEGNATLSWLDNYNSTYFIAEAGLNHNGQIDLAHELIDIACRAGAQAIKFQKRTVNELAIKSVLDAKDLRFPFLGQTYREIRESLEFSFEEYKELQRHATDLKLDFIVTPFDLKALDFLEPLSLKFYKIASHSVRNLDLIKAISESGKAVIMSTGMSTLEEIDNAVSILIKKGVDLCLLHCVSSYPTPDEDINLKVIETLKQRYSLPIGYSGHEVDDLATSTSIALGARVIERHITKSRLLEGFDHKLSLEESELQLLINRIRRIEKVLGSDKKSILNSENIARDKYNVSMASARALNKGSFLQLGDIAWKNPGTGIPRVQLDYYLGRELCVDIDLDVLIKPEMFK